MNNTMNKFSIFALFLILFGSITAFAAAPNAPEDLDGRAYLGNHGKDSLSTLSMSWEMDPDTTIIKHVTLYKATGETKNLGDFKEDQTITKIIRFSKRPGKTPFPSPYMANCKLGNLAPGTYSFYITATTAEGTSTESNIIYVQIRAPFVFPDLKITSKPVEKAKINTDYTYTVIASSKKQPNAIIEYKLVEAPKDMIIDATTGIITWKPTKKGLHHVFVEAKIKGSTFDRAKQFFVVQVIECDVMPKILLTVVNKDKEAIDGIYVHLIPVPVKDTVRHPDDHKYTKFVKTDKDGKAELEADKGKYIVKISGDYYRYKNFIIRGQYYKDNQSCTSKLSEAHIFDLACGAEETITAVITIDEDPFKPAIKITSKTQFPEKMLVNSKYTYDVEVDLKDKADKAKFTLLEAPKGMTIDPVSGIVAWTPAQTGFFGFTVKAFILDDTTKADYQPNLIQVVNCMDSTVISGNVVDQNGNIVKDGTVMVFNAKKDTTRKDTSKYGRNGHYYEKPYFARIINGKFSTVVEEGTYKIEFSGYNFYREWYNDRTTFDTADEVVVACGEKKDLGTITVEVYPKPKYFVASGTVTKESDNTPVPFCHIMFMGEIVGKNMTKVVSTMTGRDGKYQVKLDDRYEYIAKADPINKRFCDTNNSSSSDLLPQYFNLKSSIKDAEKIKLTADKTDIDFVLKARPVYKNIISGTVENEKKETLEDSHVIAFLIESKDNIEFLHIGRTAQTNDKGEYTLKNLLPGKYVIMAFAKQYRLAPGYFKENAVAELSWTKATQVVVTETSTGGPFLITLREYKKIKGRGIVKGAISGSKGKKGFLASDNSGDKIQGAVVYALDQDGNIVKSIDTDASGNFELSELAKGTYSILADKIGYQPFNTIVKLNSDNAVVSADMEMNNSSVDDNNNAKVQVSVYPNPTSNVINIRFNSLTANKAHITLSNSMGQSVYSNSVDNNFELNVQDQATGAYYLRVELDGKTTMIPVAIQR